MKNKFSIAMTLALIMAMVVTSLALADAATNQSISINSGATDTNSLSVSVYVSVLHCPPGGDMKALEVAFRNSTSDPWTVVHAVDTNWPGPDVDGCNAGVAAPASFAWTLASGASGNRTVYARFKHANDEVFAQDNINFFIGNTAPTITVNDVTKEGNTLGGWTLAFAEIGSTSDTEDGMPSVSCTPAIGSVLPLGANSVSCTATDSGGLTATDSGTVTIVDTTAPTLNLPANQQYEGNTTGGYNGAYNGATATDVVDATPTVVCTPASGSLLGLGANTIYCTATDDSSNSSGGSFTVTVVDTTAPTLVGMPSDMTVEGNTTGGANVSFTAPTATDIVDTSPSVSCVPASGSFFALGGPHAVTCTATDASGNYSSDSFEVTVVDTTPPTITFVSRLPTANSNGWNNTNVTVTWNCSDIVGVVSPTVSTTVSTEGASQSAVGTCTDTSGNTASDTQTGISIDKSAPVFGVCPSGGPFFLGSGLQSVGPISVDAAISGINAGLSTLSGSVDTSSIGLKTVNFTAVDNADNSASTSCSYSVIYKWSGFFQPIDNDKLNVAKAGSAIPVKFSLSGFQGLNIFEMGFPRSIKISCTTSEAEDTIETTVTAGGSSLNYDALADQYIYVWKTDKSWAGTCRQLQVQLNDGTLHTANFKFK